MFSKVATRVSQYQQLTQMTQLSTRAFRASTVANASKKPSIGDAVTILQSKVSGINQVVSFIWKQARLMWNALPGVLNKKDAIFVCPLYLTIAFCRTTWKSSDPSFPSVMVSPESSVSPRSKQVRWWSSSPESVGWLSTSRLTMSVSSFSETIGK